MAAQVRRAVLLTIVFAGWAVAQAQAPASQTRKASPPQETEEFFDESEPCPGTRLKTAEAKFGEYAVRTYRLPNLAGCFAIGHRGQRVHSEAGMVYEISGTAEFRRWNSKAAPVGTDVNGDGVPDVVVTAWTGGAHCCFILSVFQLGDSFRRGAVIDMEHTSGAHFADADGDGRWELGGHDWTFAYWNASFAFSAAPDVVLRLEDGVFRFAADRMRKPPPTREEMAELLQQVRNDKSWDNPEEIPPDLFLPKVLLDLIYSGNAKEAWQFLNHAWPEGRRGREKYLSEFRKRLAESPYWSAVQALNGGRGW